MAKTNPLTEQQRLNLVAALKDERLLCISQLDVMRGASLKVIHRLGRNLYIARKLRQIDCIDEQLEELGVTRNDKQL